MKSAIILRTTMVFRANLTPWYDVISFDFTFLAPFASSWFLVLAHHPNLPVQKFFHSWNRPSAITPLFSVLQRQNTLSSLKDKDITGYQRSTTIFYDSFWWHFLMTNFYDNFWWQFLLTIFVDNFFWQFLMTIFDDIFRTFFMTIFNDNFG